MLRALLCKRLRAGVRTGGGFLSAVQLGWHEYQPLAALQAFAGGLAGTEKLTRRRAASSLAPSKDLPSWADEAANTEQEQRRGRLYPWVTHGRAACRGSVE